MKRKTKLQRLKDRAFTGPAGGVFRGMATLAMGNVISRLIGIASIPALTRLYEPEDFGALAVFISLISILSPIITFRYALALPLPRRDGVAINLMVLSSGLLFGMSLITGAALWAFGTQLLTFFSMERLAPYRWLIILGLFGTSGYELLSLWATRKMAYKHIAHTTATQGLFGNLTKLAFGLIGIKPLGLLIGQVASVTGGAASLWLRLKADIATNHKFISYKRTKLVAWRYRDFPTYRLPSQFFLAFSTQSPALFFAAIYGAKDTGQLSMALTVVALPLSIMGNSISQSYYSEIAKIGIKSPHDLILITKEVTKKLAKISLAPFLTLLLGGKFIFMNILGDDWATSGEFASILSLYLTAQFTTTPVMNIFNIMRKQSTFLTINIIRAALMALIFSVATPLAQFNPLQTILTYSVAMTLFYAGIYTLVINQLKGLQK